MKLAMDEKRKIAESTARGYVRRCWWADEDDLQQQAWLLLFETEARGTFKPEVGVPLPAYLYRAAGLGVRRYLLQQSNAVTVPINKLGLIATERAELRSDAPDMLPSIEEAIDEAAWCDHARDVMRAIALDRDIAPEAVDALVDGTSDDDNMRRSVRKLRRAVSEDAEALSLLRKKIGARVRS